MPKAKAYQLQSKSRDELLADLEKLKQELQQLRVDKVTSGTASKLAKIKEVRKSIAVYNTVISIKQRNQLKAFYEGKRRLPLDLRPKLTRALRQQLSETDRARVTKRQARVRCQFPRRVYALAK